MKIKVTFHSPRKMGNGLVPTAKQEQKSEKDPSRTSPSPFSPYLDKNIPGLNKAQQHHSDRKGGAKKPTPEPSAKDSADATQESFWPGAIVKKSTLPDPDSNVSSNDASRKDSQDQKRPEAPELNQASMLAQIIFNQSREAQMK